MAVQEKIFSRKRLSKAIQQVKPPALFLWTMLVGEEIEEKTQEFEVQTKEAGRYRVPLVSRRENGILIEKEGFSVSVYKPPLMKFKVINKAEAIFDQNFGSTVYDSPEKAAQKELLEELKNLKNIGARTRLWMLSQLVTTGVCPLAEGKQGIKFGEFEKEILTDQAWSKPETDIINYLRAKQLEIQQKTGIVIDSLIITPDVEEAMLKNTQIREYLQQTNANIIRINDKTAASEGAREVMYLPTLGITVYSYKEWAKLINTNGSEEPIIPDKTIIGFKEKSFRCHYGAVALRPAPGQRATVHVAKEIVRPLYPEGTEDDLLEYISAPLVAPLDASAWFCAQVLG